MHVRARRQHSGKLQGFERSRDLLCAALCIIRAAFSEVTKDRCIFVRSNFNINKADILLQHISDDREPLGRRLLQEADAAVPEPGPDPHTEQLTHVSLSCNKSIWSGSAPTGELQQ